jgi:hypothetical protein
MKNVLFAVLISMGLFSGCSKDNTTIAYTPSCSGTAKSYKTDVAPIISSSCGACHQNFSTYSQLYSSRTSVRSMIVSGQMPQGSSLSTAQKDAIVCWIDNGAANN